MLKSTGNTLFVFLFSALLLNQTLFAFSFRSELDRNQAPLNEQVVLSIILEDDGQNILREWSLPELTDFQVVGKSTEQQINVVNGQTKRIIKLNFILAPHREGPFKMPTFIFELAGKTYRTEELKGVITAAVAKPRRSISQPVMQTFTSLPTFFDGSTTADPTFLETKIEKKELYVGEKTALHYFFIHQGRFFDGPNFYAPLGAGLRLKNLNQFTGPANRQRISRNGQEFFSDQLSFIVSPLHSGTFQIEPARIEFRQTPFEDRQVLNAETVILTAKNLPRPVPPNFSGAVGQFDWVWLDPPQLQMRQGENQTLRVKVSGRGNLDPVNTFTRVIDSQEKIDEQGRIYSEKTFEWTFTFDQPGMQKLEYPIFVYFDPFQNKYQFLKYSKTLQVQVAVQKNQSQVLDLNPPLVQNKNKGFVVFYLSALVFMAGLLYKGYRGSQNPFFKLKRKYQKVFRKPQDLNLVQSYLRDYYQYFYQQSLEALPLSQIQNEFVKKIAETIEEQKYAAVENKKATDLRPWLESLKPNESLSLRR